MDALLFIYVDVSPRTHIPQLSKPNTDEIGGSVDGVVSWVHSGGVPSPLALVLMEEAMSQAVRTESHGSWIEIVLDQAGNRNAITQELISACNEAIEVAKASEYRAVLLRAEGAHFCVGGDLHAFTETVEAGRHVEKSEIDNLHTLLRGLRMLQKPVVGAVQGACAGAGMSIMLACDLVYAADNLKLLMAYLSIGTSPDGGSTYFLPRHVGLKKAMELFLSTTPTTAQDAQSLGLVNEVLPLEELLPTARAKAEALAKGPTLAIAKLKELLNATGHHSIEQQLDLEAQLFSESSQSDDFREGVTSFVAKRKPQFKGK